jgi:TatD DNase family protein
MIDIHSHIHDKAFDIDRDEVLERMRVSGIKTVTIGTDIVESKKAVAAAEKYENVWCTIGVHPHDDEGAVFDESEFENLLSSSKKIVGVGECGLDYHYLGRELVEGKVLDGEIEKERQKKLFIQQIDFAKKHNLPLMLHGRPSKSSQDAYEDMLEILESKYANIDSKFSDNKNIHNKVGNVHFFVGNIQIAKRFLNLGFTFSFGGVTTITSDYNEVIQFLPVENIHLETDSPYVAPKIYRGQRNSPEYIGIIFEKICEIKNINTDTEKENFKKQLTLNAKNLFGIE